MFHVSMAGGGVVFQMGGGFIFKWGGISFGKGRGGFNKKCKKGGHSKFIPQANVCLLLFFIERRVR